MLRVLVLQIHAIHECSTGIAGRSKGESSITSMRKIGSAGGQVHASSGNRRDRIATVIWYRSRHPLERNAPITP